jgi:hypothetical protein
MTDLTPEAVRVALEAALQIVPSACDFELTQPLRNDLSGRRLDARNRAATGV